MCTGLASLEDKDMDRVSDKQVRIITECLSDEKKREEAMGSTNHFQIYIALWSVGFSDIAKAKKKAEELILGGNREQQLTAAYFLAHTDIPFRLSTTMIRIFEQKPDDFEIQALLMPAFMPNMSAAINLAIAFRNEYSIIKGYAMSRVFAGYDFYFVSSEEARRAYDILSTIVEKFPK